MAYNFVLKKYYIVNRFPKLNSELRLVGTSLRFTQQIAKYLGLILMLMIPLTSIQAAIYTVVNTNDAGAGSLRQAITDANANAGADIINFNITGTGPFTITLSSLLPLIAGPTVIDGYTQTGAVQGAIGSRTVMIAIDGGSQAGSRDGLFRFTSAANGSSLSGLAIYNTGSSTEVVLIEPGSSNIHIWGNYIGLLPNGTSPAASADFNGDDGVFLGDYSTNTGSFTNITIGTNGDGTNDINEGNVLSNSNEATNGGDGIQLGTATAAYTYTNIRISGNYIGVAADGVTSAPNGRLDAGVTHSNGQDGINIKSASNILIGSDANGTSDILERNIISGNRDNGIDISGTSSNISIAGNYIGTDKTGLTAIPNGTIGTNPVPFCGILATNNSGGTISNLVIGFDDAVHTAANTTAARNIISGNYQFGLQLFSVSGTGNKVSGNYIGVNATGNVALGNGQVNNNNAVTTTISAGVDITNASNILVGTDADGDDDVLEGNVISGNISARGVYIRNNSATNVVAGNYIGVGADGTTAIGNGFSGVHIDVSNNNRIGSNDDGANDAAEANIIANNANSQNTTTATSDGVRVTLNATGNRISRNIFYSNKENPIDLANNTVSVNDGVTTAGQPNLLLDYPVFTANYLSGTTMIVSGYIGQCNGTETGAGTVIGAATTVQVYKVADDGDQGGAISGNGCTRSIAHGEGVQYLGSITVPAGQFTNVSLTLVPGASFSTTDKLTGITIDAAGNTSEFGISVTSAMFISGSVYNDINSSGSTAGNQVQDGTEFGTTAGANLWAYLVNNGVIVDSAQVAQNGTYTLDGFPGTSYTIEISRQQYATGTTGVTAATIDNTMATGWSLTGEGAANIADGTANGMISLTTPASGNSANNNFGVLQPLSCATTELTTDGKFVFTNGAGGTVNVNTLNFNGWVGAGNGIIDIGTGGTYIHDNSNTQTFTHAFTGVNPLGSGAVLNISLGIRNGIAGSPISDFGKASVLTVKYGGVVYATVTTDNTTASDGHIATVNYFNSATGSVPAGYTIDYGPSPQPFGVLNLANWQIFLPASVPNNNDLVIEFDPGGSSSADAADDFDVQAVSLTACPITISGHVYNDANGLQGTPVNTVDGTGTNAGGLNAVLYDVTSGKVVAIIPVNADGTYSFSAKAEDNYSVYITTNTATVGQTTVPIVALPAGWVSTGEQNCVVTAACTGNDGITNAVLSLGTVTGNITQANFGVEQTPTATTKSFMVAPGAFSGTPPAGYPSVSGYVSIPTSSTSLTGYNGTGGNLSGTDPEDCAAANTCNSGKTFTIGTINSNTKLYYDFGAGPVLLTTGTTIPNYDPAKLVIYGQAGSGTSGSPVGFTYSITDAAGKESPFVPYTITASTPLPVGLLSFTAKAEGCKTVLNWITSYELNLSHFDIEWSPDGNGFYKEATVIAAKNSTGSSYHFNCAAQTNTSYYRLRLVDEDGTYAFSNILKIAAPCSTDRDISLYPNPAKDRIHITNLHKGDLIRIFGITGQLIMQQEADKANEWIDISQVAAGTYQVIIADGKAQIVNIKLVK